MAANLNAIALILAVVGTGFVLRRCGTGRQTGGRLAISLLAGFAALLLLCAAMCVLMPWNGHRGDPVAQWLVPGMCAAALVAFARDGRPGRGLAVACCVLAPALTAQYYALVRSTSYTGDPDALVVGAWLQAPRLRSEAMTGMELAGRTDGRRYRAGWLPEAVPAAALPARAEDGWEIPICRPTRLWHSRLTGIYGLRRAGTCGLWFSGGTLADGARHLAIRRKQQ